MTIEVALKNGVIAKRPKCEKCEFWHVVMLRCQYKGKHSCVKIAETFKEQKRKAKEEDSKISLF